MNSQLPPIDSDIREHLSRRSAGRLPDDLFAEVSAALDGVREPPARTRWPRLIWSAPRLAGAGMGVALVAILAVAVAFPAFQPGPAASPAGYPTDRALTTGELARLMAGPQLPINTTLVASVTIDSRQDVCPMNSRPTVGVVEGMDSQVCVMGATLAAQLPGPTADGIFAFRYMAPGYLGLLGQITPASSSKIAFRVAEDWPLPPDKTFLVEGWLGAHPRSCPTYIATSGGDPLDPDGYDQCESNWLTDDPNAARSTYANGSDYAGLLAAPDGGRYVVAGGMRVIDAIPGNAPVHGVYVVRAVIAACSMVDPSCQRFGFWDVLAKVADVPLPAPSSATSSPTPTTVPPATPIASPSASFALAPTGYPTDRALTSAELAAVMAGPALPLSTTVVASVTVIAKLCQTNPYPGDAVIEGLGSPICIKRAQLPLPKIAGVFAFRYLGPGTLDFLGQITPSSSSRLPFRAGGGWPAGLMDPKTFLVSGFLVRDSSGWTIVDTLSGRFPPFQSVQVDAAAGIDSIDPSQYGVFVVTAVTVSVPASSMGPQGDGIVFHVVAKVADISAPGATP